jgi:TnpA family transposase
LESLSEDEVIRDWTLRPESKRLLLKVNKNHRLWLAIQLCAMQLYGRFIENPNTLCNQVTSYLCKQVDLPPTLIIERPRRKATFTEHRKLIFNHLGFTNFNKKAMAALQTWVKSKINAGILLIEQLYPQAEQFLLASRIALPSTKQLKRFIQSLCAQYQQVLFVEVYQGLKAELVQSIEEVLHVNENISWFEQFKEYPAASTISQLQYYLLKYQRLCEIDLENTGIEPLSQEFTHYLYQLGKYYSADKIKRLKAEKRYTLMAAFLIESKKLLIDRLLQMHDQYISNICRECKHIYEEQIVQYRQKHDKAIDKIASVIDTLLKQPETKTVNLEELFEQTVSRDRLVEARADMQTYQTTSKYGYANLLQNRYTSMRRYFTDFIHLPFQAEKGSHPLITAIELIRKLDNKALKKLPDDTPHQFIDYKVSKALFDKDGVLKRSLWEMGVAIALRDATRSGDIFIAQSKKYVSFWDLVYKTEVWENERDKAYQSLNLNREAKTAVAQLKTHYHDAVNQATKQWGKDGFAQIKKGKLKLNKPDKLMVPDEVKDLQKAIAAYLPKIKIEQLLLEVDHMTGFSRHFTAIHGQNSKPPKFYKTLMASLLSQATNIGIGTMQDCTLDISVDMMRHISDTYIREETLKNANAEIVNQHTQLPLSLIHGHGHLSSSDGQRFAVTASSLISSYYPRYFGYYEKAIGIYTHVSDQYSVYNTQVISCSPREALYVLDGLLDNNSILQIKEHTTDTAGYTEHIFALCYLLGYQFMPRIRDLKDQQLYRIDKSTSYGELDVLLTKTADPAIIEEQWDQMVKVSASLKNRLAPAHEIIRRIGKGTPSDRLSKAFTQLGRLVKTDYILRYLTTPALRQKVQRQLNKGEHRHGLSRWLFFANQGKFQTGDYEEIMNKASCLSLVSNAVLYWNTVIISEIIHQLEASGKKIEKEWLSHISLLLFKHVIPMGTYFVERNPNQIEV